MGEGLHLLLHVVEAGARDGVDHQPAHGDAVQRREALANLAVDHRVVEAVRVLGALCRRVVINKCSKTT